MEISEISLSSLLCQENASFLKECEEEYINSNSCSVSEWDDEYIQVLMEKERRSFVSTSAGVCSIEIENWLKCSRLSVIKWILNTRSHFGFQFSTAFLSLMYYDRFLSRRYIDNGKLWAIRLLSVACLSLAVKMEEYEIPTLSQYHLDDHNFESNVIQKMELLVLNTLEWKMVSTTPFAYLDYFITKLCADYRGSNPKELVWKAVEIILAITKEINVMDIRPSVIAVAAILAASDDQLTKKTMESKMSVIPLWGSLERESAYSCYKLMQEIKMGKSKTPESVVLSTDVLDNSSITSVVGSKRRLTYLVRDQHCPPQKIHRP